MVKSLGADAVIDYTKQDFTLLSAKYDIIFDAVGKSSYSACKKALNKYGRYVTTLLSPKIILELGISAFTHKKIRVVSVHASGKDLTLLSNYAEANMIKPVIEKVYSPQEMPRAHQHLESEHVAGKLVVEMQFQDDSK